MNKMIQQFYRQTQVINKINLSNQLRNQLLINKYKHFYSNQQNITNSGAKQYQYWLLSIPIFLLLNQDRIQCFWGSDKLPRNKIKDRVQTLQYPAKSPVEDRIACHQLKSIDGYYVSVFDGHGGYQVSQFASENLHIELEKQLKNCQQNNPNIHDCIIESLKQTFDSIERQYHDIALQAYNIGYPQVSEVGSCALVALIKDSKLYAANIGDSRGFIVSKKGKEHTARKINRKFNANSNKEQIRLRAEFPNDPDIVVCKNNKSCKIRNYQHVTRSFGDLILKHQTFNNSKLKPGDKGYLNSLKKFNGPYISHQPDIKTFDLVKDDKYLILASDGLWDNLKKEEITNIISQNAGNKEQIVQKIYEQTYKKIAQKNSIPELEFIKIPQGQRKKFMDDISVIVVDLQNQF